MKRKHWTIAGIILVTIILYAVTTGGIAVSSVNDFGGQRNIELARTLKSDVWLAPRSSHYSVPFIFHRHSTGGPFSLRLQIWDDIKQFRKIQIDEITLEYHDGTVIRQQPNWSRELEPYTQYNSSSGDAITVEMFMLSDQIDDLVSKHADVKITLKGHLDDSNGDQVPFDVSEAFVARSRSHVMTWWQVMSNI